MARFCERSWGSPGTTPSPALCARRWRRPDLLAAGDLLHEVGVPVPGVREVTVPAGGGAEDQLHPTGVACAHGTFDQLAAHHDRLSAHGADERGRVRHGPYGNRSRQAV